MAAKVDADEKPNTFDPKRVEKIVGKIEREFEGLLAERMSYMGKCRPYRERIASAYEEGVGFGIPKGVLKAKIKERDLQRKIECIPDDFEGDERETFEQLTQALGGLADTPLGKAAMSAKAAEDKAPKASRGRPRKVPSAAAPADQPGSAVDDDDIRSDAQKLAERDRDAEAERVAAENAGRLNAGISPLPN